MYNYFPSELASGPSSDVEQQTKSQAWGAVLGIGVGVAIVGLVVYIIVKRRNYRDFSHRKLVEDTPPEPGKKQVYINLTRNDLKTDKILEIKVQKGRSFNLIK